MSGESIKYPPRSRRTNSFWEPFFQPFDNREFPPHQWDFTHDNGPSHCTLLSSQLLEELTEKPSLKKIEGVSFTECDFSGSFPEHLVFVECRFVRCDFGLSTWSATKFTRCECSKSSFTQSTFSSCEFRGCSWSEVGLSGNTTKFSDTLITNVDLLIASAYTNLNTTDLGNVRKTAGGQRRELEQTKSTLARVLLVGLTSPSYS